MRVTVGSDTYIASPVFVGADGETATDATGTPSVVVTNSAGTELTAPAVDQASPAVTGQYRAKLLHNVHTNQLDSLVVMWTATVDGLTVVRSTDVEVCGGAYMEPNELRAVLGLTDPAKYPSALLAKTVSEFETLAEAYCGCAFVPRYATETIVQTRAWRTVLDNPRLRTIRTLSVDGNTVDPTTVGEVTAGWIDWTNAAVFTWNTWPSTVKVGYEHGFDSPPEPVLRACREYVRSTLLRSTSALPRDVISETIDGGTSVRYSTADFDAGRPTGFLNVDAALNQAPMYRVPVLG